MEDGSFLYLRSLQFLHVVVTAPIAQQHNSSTDRHEHGIAAIVDLVFQRCDHSVAYESI